ncbi:MAG: 1-deoxy-D-xylulose-5-phosphate synthase [Xanthomonadales bacterium]|nr:1-deoxy-D-xylulose-5-phosphate synthase [Gammaproteobacteria bacterium]MBT8055011.1 1-deoxy-D-xylulose-5-phosphate synthase [Gammaproteobacteria bacterium]NND56393.1 1-deoxy-D-xylulose-5-phosphate synthase [Xanthomonadales bacterium]NNK50450.1 1-deoxy-D-xylulose-5-phosphate synthase [Xanthomonadales bacterium]
MNEQHYPLLSSIESPADLRELDEELLPQVADELRRYLIESVAASGGHFGAGLGCVELTVALHFLYETPDDRIVWDVGHQAYPHKILCERAGSITTIKQKLGLAPFPKRSESEYDTFGTGHSSTSISAALGMAAASDLQDVDRKCVAIIGDGAMTAGMAYEALNHGGDLDHDLLVVLNENQMSISPNVGAMTKMLGRLMSGPTVTGIRERGKSLMHRNSRTWRFMSRWEEHIKGMVMPSTLFEELGFNYLGPIDGHDIPTLVRTIRTARDVHGPNLLHIITEKGKGYEPAEKDPVKYHAVGPFNPETGVVPKAVKEKTGPTYTEIFGEWVCDMAEQDKRLLAITPAMREGSGLVEFHRRFPERYFDVGIAEQHSVTLAAGMACENAHPVVAIYSTFLQRAYDQMIHDVALQDLPVLFAIDRAGLVGPDGPTHAGSFDLSFMRCIPGMVIMAPADENECRQMLYTGFCYDGPAAVRYPRGRGPGVEVQKKMTELPLGKSVTVAHGNEIAILAFGSMVETCSKVAGQLNATLINMRFVKPLDREAIIAAAAKHPHLVTVEENAIAGGAGSGVNELLASEGLKAEILNIGLEDNYIQHGTREECLHQAGLDSEGILARIVRRFGASKHRPVPDSGMRQTGA